MTFFKILISILILTYSTFIYAEKKQYPAPPPAPDEQVLDKIFSIDSIKNYCADKKQKLFNSIQTQLQDAYAATPLNLLLIKSLVDKQQCLFPDERKSYIDMAAYYDKSDKSQKMFEQCKTALTKDNVFYKDQENRLISTAYTLIGRHYLEHKKFEDAYNALSKALVEQTPLVNAFYYMGNTCFQLKKYRECQNNYTYGFTRDIKLAYPIDYFFFAIALHKNGFTDKAQQMLEIGCQQYPNEQGLRLNLGYIYREQDKLIEAYLEFYAEQILFGPQSQFFQPAKTAKKMDEKLISLRKDEREMKTLKNITAWELSFNKNNYEKAITDIKNAKTNFGKYNFSLYFLEYLTYFYMEDYDTALKKIEYIQKKTFDTALTYISQFEIYSKLGDNKKANKYLEQALRLDPDNWRVLKILNSSKNPEKTPQEKDNGK